MSLVFNNIKLVVWDLDETFWSGTLSENNVVKNKINIQLIKDLTDRGIINSICSKNDKTLALDTLNLFGIRGFFVFPSIDWSPKGKRLKELIKDMGLRPQNTLFLDDNPSNLNEALFYVPGIMTATPDVLPDLYRYVQSLPISDKSHQRLKQYLTLEKRQGFKGQFSDNKAFLYNSIIVVRIKDDCIRHLPRIHELIQRTNQLNYTKIRIGLSELENLLKNDDYDCRYIEVQDKFGDYGIIGFYAINGNKCDHFLFSCRVLGFGVEQYVYSILNYPTISIQGDVAVQLQKIPAPEWINHEIRHNHVRLKQKTKDYKLVFLGPCDLKALVTYVDSSKNVISELTYVDSDTGKSVQHGNHSVNYLTLPFATNELKDSLIKECVFNDEGIFHTRIYDPDIDLVVVSSLNEAHLGIYQRNCDGLRIAFGPWRIPITDPCNWHYYKKNHIYNIYYDEEWLRFFSNNYTFIGRISPEEYIQNLKTLLDRISPKAHVCVMLGSELAFPNEQDPTYTDRHTEHALFNCAIREFAANEPRLHYLDINECVQGTEEYMDIINHFQRIVYFRAFRMLDEIVEEITGLPLRKRNSFSRLVLTLGRWIKIRIHPQGKLYRFFHDAFFKFIKL